MLSKRGLPNSVLLELRRSQVMIDGARRIRGLGRGTACIMVASIFSGALGIASASPREAQAATASRRFLIIGDSYSSGEGLSGTNPERGPGNRECARATGGPYAKAWGVHAYERSRAKLSTSTLGFTACSGALADEVNSQLAEAGVKHGGMRPWDVVTFTFGGNNLNFENVLRGCLDIANGWDRFDATRGCDVTEDELLSRVDRLVGTTSSAKGYVGSETLPRMYDKVAKQVAQGGDVVVVGYPQLVEEVARWDGWRRRLVGSCEGFEPVDIGMLRSVTGHLNRQIADAVAAANRRHAAKQIRFHFFDASAVFESGNSSAQRHGLCAPEPWLNGVTFGISSGDIRLGRSFHPNDLGHVNLGITVGEFLRSNVRFDDKIPMDGCSRMSVQNALGLQDFQVWSDPVCKDGWAHVDICKLRRGEVDRGECFDPTWILRIKEGRWTHVGGMLNRCAETFVQYGAPESVASKFFPFCVSLPSSIQPLGLPRECARSIIGFPIREVEGWDQLNYTTGYVTVLGVDSESKSADFIWTNQGDWLYVIRNNRVVFRGPHPDASTWDRLTQRRQYTITAAKAWTSQSSLGWWLQQECRVNDFEAG